MNVAYQDHYEEGDVNLSHVIVTKSIIMTTMINPAMIARTTTRTTSDIKASVPFMMDHTFHGLFSTQMIDRSVSEGAVSLKMIYHNPYTMYTRSEVISMINSQEEQRCG